MLVNSESFLIYNGASDTRRIQGSFNDLPECFRIYLLILVYASWTAETSQEVFLFTFSLEKLGAMVSLTQHLNILSNTIRPSFTNHVAISLTTSTSFQVYSLIKKRMSTQARVFNSYHTRLLEPWSGSS